MNDVSGDFETDEQCYVVFKVGEKSKMQLFGIHQNAEPAEVEAQIAEQTGLPNGSVAYYMGEASATKQETANAAVAAGLTYISPENINKIRAFLEEYSDDFSMSAILGQHTRISSRRGSPEKGRWAEPTVAELNALEEGADVFTFDSLS